MEASGGKAKRPIVIDFLLTLMVTFCIGVAASLALVGSVILMAGDARGAALSGSPADARCAAGGAARTSAKITELALTHLLVTKYAGLVAIDRAPLWHADSGHGTAARPARTCSRTRITRQRGQGSGRIAALRADA